MDAAQSWYAINQTEGSNEASIRIYGDIGAFGITSRNFADALDGITAETIHVHISSNGGSTFEGLAIHSALNACQSKVVVHIDGLAASAGSFIAMSGDEVRMADGAFLMMHENQMGVLGEADDLRRFADLSDKISDSIAGIYQGKAGKTRKYWRGKMAAESWFSASEAKAEGLVDAIDGTAKPQNCFDFKAYNHAPDAARELWAKQQQQAAPIQISAPEPSPSGDVTPVSQIQEPPMATDTTVAPAQVPAAGSSVSQGDFKVEAIQGYIENGKRMGRIEGEQAAQERFKALMEACPDRLDLVCGAFQTGQSAATLSLMYKATQAESAKTHAMQLEKDKEIARLHAQLATGGHPGVNFSPAPASLTSTEDAVEGMEPEVQAKMEWDGNPIIRAQNANEKHWILYRTNQLKGNLRILKVAK